MAKLYIGLSGYSYKEWQGEGLFYPPGLKPPEFLGYYSSRFNALEAAGMWYQMPTESSVGGLIASSSEGFKVSPKMHREVTHLKRLKAEGFGFLKTFVERLGPLETAQKLGPILVQTPPNLKRDDDLLNAFLSQIPHRETLQWSLEFRHESWQAPEVEETLRSYGIAWVGEDTDEEDAQRRNTASFVYVRLRRIEYSDEQLAEWTSYFRAKITEGKDCYVYCRHKDTKAPWLWADRILELI